MVDSTIEQLIESKHDLSYELSFMFKEVGFHGVVGIIYGIYGIYKAVMFFNQPKKCTEIQKKIEDSSSVSTDKQAEKERWDNWFTNAYDQKVCDKIQWYTPWKNIIIGFSYLTIGFFIYRARTRVKTEYHKISNEVEVIEIAEKGVIKAFKPLGN